MDIFIAVMHVVEAVTVLVLLMLVILRITCPKRQTGRNYNTWIHLTEKDFQDDDGVLHQKFMCPKCGLIHEFLDGHTSQYNYCPQCGLYLGE